MVAAGLELAISANQRPQTQALDRAATQVGDKKQTANPTKPTENFKLANE